MIVRAVTSINWLAGTLAIGGALLLPLLTQTLDGNAARAEAEAAVQAVADSEKSAFARYEHFVYFTTLPEDLAKAAKDLGKPVPSGGRFAIDAVSDADNALILRAVTAPAVLQQGTLPPMQYVYRIKDGTAEGSGQWTALSGQTSGLLALLKSIAAPFL